MRVGEFLALSPADIDFDANKINITKTYNWKLKYTSAPKTETSVRKIAMPESVMRELKRYLSSMYDAPDRVVEAVSQKVLSARLAKYAAKAGVKQIRLHDLRHSHASFLIHHGIPVTRSPNALAIRTQKSRLKSIRTSTRRPKARYQYSWKM